MAIKHHGNRFLNRIFTPKEQEYALRHQESSTTFAGRFAAKEAIVKALGTGIREGVAWTDIEVLNDELGKPFVILASHLKERFPNSQILITISHSKSQAIAFAVYSSS